MAVDRKGALIAGKVRATLTRYGLITQSEGIRANVTPMNKVASAQYGHDTWDQYLGLHWTHIGIGDNCSLIPIKFLNLNWPHPLNNYSGL